jgi:hypothetical protein
VSWRVSGTYLESCNCDPVCPCRTVGGIPGGRSTTGICVGALSWQIETGHADALDLAGLAVAMVYRYDDDEPGSPWVLTLHVDERAGEEERLALADIFLGRRGGRKVLALPWVRKASTVLAVEPSRIELDVRSVRGWLRVSDRVELRIARPFAVEERVSCIVPGHDVPGSELQTEILRVDDGPFTDEFVGHCAFTAPFAYAADD